MEDAGRLLLAILAAYASALVAGAMARRPGTLAIVAFSTITAAILAAPLLIPADRLMLRAAACFVSTDLMFRLIDFRRELRNQAHLPTFREFCWFLIAFPVLLVVFSDRNRRLEGPRFAWLDALRVFGGIVGVGAGFVLLDVVAAFSVFRGSFLLDHVAKMAIFLLTIESASQGLYGLERLAGFDTTPIVRTAVLSRTVAEFWIRYNTRVHRWLYENTFRPCGGRRAPARGILLVFFVSAVLHELMFGIATSRFDGYQFIFFAIQGPAVLASGYLERLANRGGIAGAVVAHLATIVWMAGTSVFFFHGVNRIFPFLYVSEFPLP
jgi:hypothetical protein